LSARTVTGQAQQQTQAIAEHGQVHTQPMGLLLLPQQPLATLSKYQMSILKI
jgi:hypothetical protein